MIRLIRPACVMEYAVSMRYCLSLVLLIAAVACHVSPVFGCTVCHSKNPRMVRMHEALQFKDCFVCHQPGGISSGPGLRDQMFRDQRCVACHGVPRKPGTSSNPAS
ncbi:MAG TPA: cytochrome c3 family protein [Nitrospirota bacterium]|nr:cytochrome c3 family protein [Nitrospirota bacterium]